MMNETDYDILIALAGADGHSSSVYDWLLDKRNRDIVRGFMAPNPFVDELLQRFSEAEACIGHISMPNMSLWTRIYRPGITTIRFTP